MEMNSEPSGTDEDIQGGESAIDIFILCKDDRDSQQLIGQLTPQGYRITLFTDSTDLLESLHTGKPNLLICDTTGPEQDGYTVCREIKTDVDLWRIPVLLVTGVANLGDLLIVLDSNADNFIARPYNHQYLLSLVDIMLTSPVEKPDPEKIRTQFKIQHEGREYVIMADRRKLLEFLLSSFEMAVGRAAELEQTQRAFDGLKSTLERRVAERTSELSTETARLQTVTNGQTRELESVRTTLSGLKNDMVTLRSRLEEREMDVTRKKAELATLTQELETTRARFAEAEDTIRTLGTEKDELEHALRGDADILNRDLEQTRADLSAAKKELAEVSGQRVALETQLAGLTHDHEESERALGTRSIEIEQLRSALNDEKSRADAAGQEVKSALLEKARAEQDLRQMVEEITEKAKQQSQECLRLADELAAEKEHRASTEQQYSELAQEAAKKEAGFIAEKGTLMEHHDALQQKCDALTESVGAERQKSATLEADLVRIIAAKDQITGEIQALKEQLDTTVASLEEEKRLRAGVETSVKEIAETKDSEVRELNTTIGALRQDLEKARAALESAEQEREAMAGAHKSLSDDLAAAELAKAQSEKLARSAASDMEQIREELETEQRLRHATEEKLSEETQAKRNIEQTSNAISERTAAKERELLAKIQELSDNLTSEREAHCTTEETLARVAREKEQVEQQLRAINDSKVTEEAQREDNLKKLEVYLKTVLARLQSLEEQLRDAEREQATKEAALQALETEIERAGAALAAEKEERHAAQEECAEAKDALATLRKRTQIPSATIEEVPSGNHAMVAKGPDLPTVIMHGPLALSRKEIDHPVPVQQPADPVKAAAPAKPDAPQVRIQSVEDLFEEPRELDINDLSDAIPTPAAPGGAVGSDAPEITGDDTAGTAGDDDAAPDEGDLKEATTIADEGETDDGEAADEGGDESMSGEEQVPEAGIPAFSRQQWFDLLKWAHNADALTHEDRLRIVKLGRLLQKGRRLTGRQETQLEELVTLAYAKGYRPKE
ncbi:MAG: response regulator [Methanoregula sp.]|jgi:DNA-binding response OmpR family regulator|uniref:response regulator n=1 Tax=Methanoregula sp. TaxID=2052170 RepID=UPI003D0C12F0